MLGIGLAALLLAVVLLAPSVGLASRSAEPVPALSPQTRVLTGYVYAGREPDTTSALPGVVVTLYGSDNAEIWGVLLGNGITDETGTYILGTEEVYEFYHIVETDPPGYHSTDVQAGTASLRWQGTATEEWTMRLFYELGYRFFRMPWEMGPRQELVGPVESGRIARCRTIDLGCGTGSNVIFLAQQGFDVIGVDFAVSAIEKAKRRANAARVRVEFVVDDPTNLRRVQGTFDFLVDYGALDDLRPKGRDLYLRNVLPLTHPGSQFLLWCFEWPTRWWERFPLGMALEPGEAERRFGEHFQIERIAGKTNLSG